MRHEIQTFLQKVIGELGGEIVDRLEKLGLVGRVAEGGLGAHRLSIASGHVHDRSVAQAKTRSKEEPYNSCRTPF